MSSEMPPNELSVSSSATTLPRYSSEPATGTNNNAGTTGSALTLKDEKTTINQPSRLPASASTTSRTRDRLQEAELELKKLRDTMKEERAIAERLKLEAAAVDSSSPESKRRIQQLERDVRGSDIKSSRPSNTGLFKAMCSTDLLFLIDTTSSMKGHINAAKEQVKSIVAAVTEAFFNEAEIRLAVVGYKDHCNSPSIQFLDFVRSADKVRSFLSELRATGGGDVPEDVLGGIKQALNASWKVSSDENHR